MVKNACHRIHIYCYRSMSLHPVFLDVTPCNITVHKRNREPKMDKSIKRYTELPYVLQALCSRELTLLSPGSWDDKNDAFFVEEYRKKANHGSIVATCLSAANPTYHHWKLFTHGASGAALYFKRREFEDWLEAHPKLEGQFVVYRTEDKLREHPPSIAELPYVKRWAYRAEEEFRLLLGCANRNVKVQSVEFDLGMVEQVVLNPWLPKPTFQAVKKVIQSIDGCSELPVLRATMVQSDSWQKLALHVVAEDRGTA